MFLSMMPDHVKYNIDIEGFGHRWDDHYNKYVYDWDAETLPGIQGGKKQTVMFKPMLGLVNQSKLLPVKYCPIVIELELCNSNLDPIITPGKKNAASDNRGRTTRSLPEMMASGLLVSIFETIRKRLRNLPCLSVNAKYF